MPWFNANGQKCPETVKVVDDKGREGWSFNPSANAEWREQNGYIYDHDPRPAPPAPAAPDTSAFDTACAKFREICAAIGEAIGDPDFKGGFDEMEKLQRAPVFGTIEGLQLAQAWNAANELCKYEGHKLGLEQPEWWYECWRQVEEAEV